MHQTKWDPRQRWLGDSKPIAREINAQKARHDERQTDIMSLIGVQRQALARRMRGETPWERWELEVLAKHWGITLAELVPESEENDTNGFPQP
jgi:BetR domain